MFNLLYITLWCFVIIYQCNCIKYNDNVFYDVTIAIGPTPTSINPICSLIAATDVELYYTMWSCDVDGQPITNPCSTQWTGLNCTNTTDIGIITSISLDAVGINGTIPSNIGQLTSLRELYLNNNTLTGSIPRNLFNLLNLITFNLDRKKSLHKNHTY